MPWAEEREGIDQALAALPDEDRAVVVLRFFADLTVADTARALTIPEGTVKTRTRRALAALREGGLGDATQIDVLDQEGVEL